MGVQDQGPADLRAGVERVAKHGGVHDASDLQPVDRRLEHAVDQGVVKGLEKSHGSCLVVLGDL